jgi:hypothetical protein
MKKLGMQFKAGWMCAFLFLGLPAMSFAGGSACSNATAVIPDGRTLELDYVQAAPPPNNVAWYQFNATANHSYSVEVEDNLDADNGDSTVSFYAAPVNCSSPVASTNYTDTHLTEPAAGPHATRFSFVPTVTGTYYVSVLNNGSIGHYVTVTVNETTLYLTNWSTYGNLTDYFGFQNTTSQCINYTLTLIPAAGSTQNTSSSGTVGTSCPAPTVEAAVNTSNSGLNLTSQAGAAILTHNGPPGAIQAYALAANFATTPFTIVPLSWAPMRGK